MVRGLVFFATAMFVYAQNVIEVSADRIVSDQLKGQTVVSGNVVIIKDEDVLHAQKVTIQMGKNKKPSEYRATGNVRFRVTTQDRRKFKGSADTLVYDALMDEYRLLGGARVQEEGKANAIKGKSIVFNRKSGSASVVGDGKKPAKITFSLDEMKKEDKKAGSNTRSKTNAK